MRVAITELRLGDRVAALNPTTGRLVYSEVLLFLDRDPDQQRRFITLRTASGLRMSLTETHLIHVAATSGCLETMCFRPSYAGSVEVGHRVLVASAAGDDEFHVEEVIAVSTESYRGVYAPLTAAGTLVVDNVVVSCYAVIDSQRVAHAAFGPLRVVANMCTAFRHLVSWSSLLRSSSGGSTVPRTLTSGASSTLSESDSSISTATRTVEDTLVGVHWYADFLYSVARWLMPGHMVL